MKRKTATVRTASRAARQVGARTLALLAVIGKAHRPQDVRPWVEKHGVARYLSPVESRFFERPRPPKAIRVSMSWRTEALAALLWALRGTTNMPSLAVPFDVWSNELARRALKDPSAFLRNVRLRPKSEIVNMEAFLYRQHWRVRDAELSGPGAHIREPGDPPLEELDPEIVYERRYALSWLIAPQTEWDSVPTDT